MKEPLILIPGLGFGPDLFEHQVQHLREVADPVVVTLTDEAMDRQIEQIMSAAGGGDSESWPIREERLPQSLAPPPRPSK